MHMFLVIDPLLEWYTFSCIPFFPFSVTATMVDVLVASCQLVIVFISGVIFLMWSGNKMTLACQLRYVHCCPVINC
jgi:hypothetical protein